MKALILSLVFTALASVPAFGAGNAASVVTQVSVRANGDLLVDGVKTDVRSFHLLLAARGERLSEIWLYRASTPDASRTGSEVVGIARSFALGVQPLKSDPLKILPSDARFRTR